MQINPADTPTQAYVSPQGDFDQPPKKSWAGGCLIGCLVTAAIMMLLCAGLGFFAYTKGPGIAVSWSRTAASAVLEESDLPLDEQEAILVQFDRAADAFLSGEMSFEDTGQLLEDLAQSPVVTFIVMFGIEKKYLDESGLSDEEKDEAKRTLVRLSRGVMEDQFPGGEIERLSEHVLENAGTDKARLKEHLTDEELRTFFAEAKSLCDEKEIPDEEFDMRISNKIKEIIDKRVGAEEEKEPEAAE